MKLTELILVLHQMMLEHGNLTVYMFDADGTLTDPAPVVAEGGSMTHPYPGVYLS